VQQITDKLLSHNVVSSTHRLGGIRTRNVLVIGTDCIGSCKSNYYMITTTTSPYINVWLYIKLNINTVTFLIYNLITSSFQRVLYKHIIVLSFYVSLRSEFSIVMSVTISAYKRCSVRLHLQLYIWGLIYVICVCLRIVVSNTYCVVFLLCLSSSCVLCTLFCQFLWIVHYWLPIRFSLTFIYKLTS